MNFPNRKLGLIENLFDILHDIGSMIDVNVVRIEGSIKPAILQQALDCLQKLHPLLQSHIMNLEDGAYFQWEGTTKIPLYVIDKQDENQWLKVAEEELHQKFPRNASPLCRVTLLPSSISNGINEIIVTFHHAIIDGMSCMLFVDQLLSYYQQMTPGEDIPKVVTMQLLPPLEKLLNSSLVSKNNVAEKQDNQVISIPQLIIEEEAPPSDRYTCLVTRILSQDMTLRLSDRCKQEKTTVHGALSAAMFLAVAKIAFTDLPLSLSCGSNVNLRKSLFYYLEDLYMTALTPETILPNGMKIFYLREEEVLTLYEQIQEYFRNGIELHEGDTVFDVGANIGLFTLWVYHQCNQNVNVYAFEPIPAIFDVLQANAQRVDPEKLKVFPCGLSREAKIMTFAYYPNATPLSNAYPEGLKDDREQLKRTVLKNLKDAPAFIRWLRWLPPFLRSFILDFKLEKAFQIETVNCQLRTISDIVRTHNIQQIDLLKVDVEKSELDVLLGIEEPDWQIIKQVVVEVHDLDSRVEKITTLLKEHGLSKITIEQEPIFKGSKIFNLYALR